MSEREREAKRILERLETEREKLFTGPAPDAPSGDRIEVLGKRIARVLSVFLVLLCFYWLWQAFG